MSIGKDMIILLTVGLIKKMSSQYFPPYVVSKNNNNTKVMLDLSGYAKKDDLKNFKGKDYIEKITSINITLYNQSPLIFYDNEGLYLGSNSDLIKQDKVTYNHGSTINIYVVYRMASYKIETNDTLCNCLFGHLIQILWIWSCF